MSDAPLTSGLAPRSAWRLEARILVIILPLVTVMLGFMGFWSHRSVRHEALLQEENEVRRSLEVAAHRIDAMLRQPSADLVSLSRSALIRRYHFNVRFGFNDALEQDAATLAESFRQLLDVSGAYRLIAFRDDGGGLVVETRNGEPRPPEAEVEAAIGSLTARVSPQSGPQARSVETGGAWRLQYGAVVREDDGTRIGDLLLVVDLRLLHEVMEGLRRGATSLAVILQNDAAVLSADGEHPGTWDVARLASAVPGAAAGSDPGVAKLISAKDALLGVVGLGQSRPRVLAESWRLALVVPHEDFLGRIATVGRDTLMVTVIAVLLVGAVSSSVVVRISRELRDATAKLEQRMEDLSRAKRELETTQAQLVQSAKLAALGELVAGVAHEINNPLGFLYANVRVLARYVREIEELARNGLAAPATAESQADREHAHARLELLTGKVARLLDGCQVGAERTKSIVEKLRHFSRAGAGEVQAVDLNESLETAVMLLGHRLEGFEVRVHRDLEALPRYTCKAGALNQVFVNLLANALDAMDGKGDIWIASRVQPPIGEVDGEVLISVRDSGPGIPAHVLPRIFEPFFTTKGPTKGTGLGLSVSYGIVRDHGGTIEARNHPQGGAEFIVRLPLPERQETRPGGGARTGERSEERTLE